MRTKVCNTCKQEKSIVEFYSRILESGNTGYSSSCKVCMKERSKLRNSHQITTHNDRCAHCDTILTNHKSIYCSRSCATAAQHNSPKVEVTCSVCNVTFLRKNSHAQRSTKRVFCSLECKNKFYEDEGRSLRICIQCGKEEYIPTYRIGKSKYCSKACAAAWRSENIFGSHHPSWREGRAQAEQADRNNKEARTWSSHVKRRDSYVCQECGTSDGRMVAHHIQRWKNNPSLRLDLDNGITLCTKCHAKYTKLERAEDKRERINEKASA